MKTFSKLLPTVLYNARVAVGRLDLQESKTRHGFVVNHAFGVTCESADLAAVYRDLSEPKTLILR